MMDRYPIQHSHCQDRELASRSQAEMMLVRRSELDDRVGREIVTVARLTRVVDRVALREGWRRR